MACLQAEFHQYLPAPSMSGKIAEALEGIARPSTGREHRHPSGGVSTSPALTRWNEPLLHQVAMPGHPPEGLRTFPALTRRNGKLLRRVTNLIIYAEKLPKHLLHHFAAHVRQPEMPPLILERQPLMIDPERVENGRLQIMYVYAVRDDVVAEVIGFA